MGLQAVCYTRVHTKLEKEIDLIIFNKQTINGVLYITRLGEEENVIKLEANETLLQQFYDFAWDTFAFELAVFYEVKEEDIGIVPLGASE